METAALFAVGTVVGATVTLFITGRGLRLPRSEGESPLLCAARRNSCKSLFVIRNFSSPGLFFGGVVGGGAAAVFAVLATAGTAGTAGTAVIVVFALPVGAVVAAC